MDKLEKSVRSCLKEYGSDLRHGKYTYSRFSGKRQKGIGDRYLRRLLTLNLEYATKLRFIHSE